MLRIHRMLFLAQRFAGPVPGLFILHIVSLLGNLGAQATAKRSER